MTTFKKLKIAAPKAAMNMYNMVSASKIIWGVLVSGVLLGKVMAKFISCGCPHGKAMAKFMDYGCPHGKAMAKFMDCGCPHGKAMAKFMDCGCPHGKWRIQAQARSRCASLATARKLPQYGS